MRKGTGPFLEAGHQPRDFPPIRILGVDPGIAATGFGVIDFDKNHSIEYRSSGVLRSQRRQTFPQTIQQIFQGLTRQIEKFAPHFMAIEKPFYAKNVQSAMLLGQARGVAILAAAEAGVEVQEYSPLEVKQAVVGYGRADKEQVQSMIQVLLHLSQRLTPDAADALAVALCLAHSLPWQVCVGMAKSRNDSGPTAIARRYK